MLVLKDFIGNIEGSEVEYKQGLLIKRMFIFQKNVLDDWKRKD